MDADTLKKLGVPSFAVREAQKSCGIASNEYGLNKDQMKKHIKSVCNDPDSYEGEEFSSLANRIHDVLSSDPAKEEKPYTIYGNDLIGETAKEQMKWAMRLSIAEKGALMADAHLGYGLPVGGVLAVKDAVIPGAVGVDIACRMKCTIFDIEFKDDEEFINKLKSLLRRHTRFGLGARFEGDKKKDHPIMDEDWGFDPFIKNLKDYAWCQLGSSGGGNHFAEFGVVKGLTDTPKLAILTHSGSRGPGYKVSEKYMDIAKEKHPEFDHFDYPDSFNNLAWLSMDSHEGQKYWAAMNFMAQFAEACHQVIHRDIAKELNANIVDQYENHHNLCFKEMIDGEEYFVHRKGATPSKEGETGIIPASMNQPSKIVRGKGASDSLNSSSHGCGRVMGRRQAKRQLDETDWQEVDHIEVIGGGLDEHPSVYKDIDKVMNRQKDCVEEIGEFEPMVVRMADD